MKWIVSLCKQVLFWVNRTDLAWSNVSNRPLWDHGYVAGCNPTSPGELALTSPRNGRVP